MRVKRGEYAIEEMAGGPPEDPVLPRTASRRRAVKMQ